MNGRTEARDPRLRNSRRRGRAAYAAYPRWKRRIDLLASSLLLLLTIPIQLTVAGVVRRHLGSPVLFRQLRPGRDGELFEMIKFRTMLAVDAVDGDTSDSARLTPLGRRLRALSLDELPALWNVVRGEMSLVGPRPLLPQYLDRYTPEQRRRHEVRPGITGLAQVSGRNALSWEERFALDIYYVEHCGPRLDLSIIWRTLSSVIHREGINAPGEATMTEFNPGGATVSPYSATSEPSA